jgi:hypothetical protein
MKITGYVEGEDTWKTGGNRVWHVKCLTFTIGCWEISIPFWRICTSGEEHKYF